MGEGSAPGDSKLLPLMVAKQACENFLSHQLLLAVVTAQFYLQRNCVSLLSKPERDGSWLPGGVLGSRGPGHAFLNCYFRAAHSSLELESFSLEALNPVLLGGQIPTKYGDRHHLGQPWEQPSTHWLDGVKGGCWLLREISGSVAWETDMLDDRWLVPASLWTSVSNLSSKNQSDYISCKMNRHQVVRIRLMWEQPETPAAGHREGRLCPPLCRPNHPGSTSRG